MSSLESLHITCCPLSPHSLSQSQLAVALVSWMSPGVFCDEGCLAGSSQSPEDISNFPPLRSQFIFAYSSTSGTVSLHHCVVLLNIHLVRIFVFQDFAVAIASFCQSRFLIIVY